MESSPPVDLPSNPATPVIRPDFYTRFTSERAKSIRAEQIRRSNQRPADDSFSALQRDFLRARIQEINVAIEKALAAEDVDSQRVDRLAAAWSKLAEQERISDGRPLPGSRRPRDEREKTLRLVDLPPPD